MTQVGDLTITGSTINDNGFAVPPQGPYLDNGVVSFLGKLVNIAQSAINHNFGNGVQANAADLTVNDSDISSNGNNGLQAGQGIEGSPPDVSATVTRSTVNDNGLDGIESWGEAAVTSSIVAGNFRTGVFGHYVTVTDSTVTGSTGPSHGGIYARNDATVTNSTIANNGIGITVAYGTATVVSSTVSGNASVGIYGYSGWPDQPSPYTGTSTIKASILANNGNGQNCIGTVTNQGYNLSTDASCGTIPQTRGPLNLQPLADNDGLTAGQPDNLQTIKTIALGPGSIAIDTIPVEEGQCVAGTTTDERGVARPRGFRCDIGAFETAGEPVLPGSTLTVHRGYWAVLRIAVASPTGENISSRSLPVKSVELIGPSGQVIPFAHAFRFGRFHRTPGYQLQFNTRNLALGTWRLEFKVDGQLQLYPVSFTVVR